MSKFIHRMDQEFKTDPPFNRKWRRGKLIQTFFMSKDPSILYFRVKKEKNNEYYLVQDHVFLN